MSQSDEHRFRDEKLPVTEEVGDEGGSFADPTYQEAAKSGIRGPGLSRDEAQNDNDVPGDAIRRDQVAGGGVGSNPDPAEGMKKYPTE